MENQMMAMHIVQQKQIETVELQDTVEVVFR